jgi:ATP-dependent DNA helicase RecG
VPQITPDTPLQALKGIGPARGAQLDRLGLRVVRDLLYLLPRRYEDRRQFAPIARLRPGEFSCVQGTVTAVGPGRTRRGIPYAELQVTDGSGTLPVRFYRQPYLAKSLRKGARLVLAGRLAPYPPREMVNPEYELLEGEESSLHTGRVVPIYPLSAGLSQRFLRRLVAELAESAAAEMPDPLPALFREARGLPTLPAAIRGLHLPASPAAAAAARGRLAFEEFFLFSLALLRQRAALVGVDGIPFRVPHPAVEALAAALPFRLTAAQARVLEAIHADMAAPRPMHRLLQGDVGSGKSIVAFLAALGAAANGFQAAVMAPTEILAAQHAERLAPLAERLGVPLVHLAGGMAATPRQTGLRLLATETPLLAVGTHALLQSDVRFGRLGLVVVDEQHRFGVLQRAALGEKGGRPDVLVMTATPIPRSLALVLYGDLDLSVIDELPPGRGTVTTHWLEEEGRARIAGELAARLTAGERAYVVCPVVEESAAELKAAVQTAEEYRRGPLGRFGVGLTHGRQSGEEKLGTLAAFREGRIRLLVSTTVVEVGLDVPEATVMILEHGDRLGLAQLHQLRGRIGRSGRSGVCYVMADRSEVSEEGRQRLEAFVRERDGFALAEADLRLRGPGEFFGTRQAGLDGFRLGDLASDLRLLEEARTAAAAVLAECPELDGPWQGAREAIRSIGGGRLGLAQVI